MTLQPSNLWASFEGVVADRFEATALIFGDEMVSFAVLRKNAERCAAWLAASRVGRGDVVAIQLPKRHDTYALWLACLRHGAIYLFVDPRNPPERTGRILARVRPRLFITTHEGENPFGQTLRLADAEAGQAWLRGLEDATPGAPAPVSGLDPAYIMFTSGSTGEPKGAVIPHQGVQSLMRWGAACIGAPAAERFSNINPLHFDNSVFDLYCGLLNGSALVPVDTGELTNPMQWVRRLRDGRASVVFAVPTLFQTLDQLRLLEPEKLPDARVFLFGGEGFPVAALGAFHARFKGRARLVNVYGPTETSCICSSIEIDETALATAGQAFPSLGRMHTDFEHAVLDEQGAPVPQNEPGELWIGGANVGLGYYAAPEETACRFRQDPRQDRYRSIWYRTGDLVCEDGKGLLWFVGRADNQVKIRGHRIELEEIDLTIEGIPGVQRAVCVAVTGEDGPELRLAFSAGRPVPEEEIRDACATRLPAYMHPARFVQLDRLPQNANGKVDRRAVRALMEAQP